MAEKVELKTERLLLRAFRLDDVDDVLAYASDPEWARYLPVPQPYSRRDAEEFIARRVLASWETNPTFAIVMYGKVIGGIGLRIDAANQRGELGYSIARSFWGKGLIPEAARRVIDWGFRQLSLAKIFARADIRNERSWRVMEKLGMTHEGLLRSHVAHREERIDEVHYGLLREEWEKQLEAVPST